MLWSTIVAVALLAGLLALSACGGDKQETTTTAASVVTTAVTAGPTTTAAPETTTTEAAPTRGELLTLGTSVVPTSLDPSKWNTSASDSWIVRLAYEPLIKIGEDGSYQPGLALEWNWVGTGNTLLEVKLRPDVLFSDGTPVTAEAVAASIMAWTKSANTGARYGTMVTSAEATDDLTVQIGTSSPCPVLPYFLTSMLYGGCIVSPAGLADTEALANATAGAGPYMLDPAQTVANDHYTFVPNPNYYDQTAIHYNKVVYKVYPDASAALAAVQSGQCDIVYSDANTAAGAGDLPVYGAPGTFVGIDIFDRLGTVCKPLGDVRVRQALNYAIDNKAITTAVFGAFAQPNQQLASPSFAEYDAALESTYTYDPEKAKALLADAGYANGFTLDLGTFNFPPVQYATEAVAEMWRAIGITVNLEVNQTPASAFENVMAKKYVAFGTAADSFPLFLKQQDWFSANPTWSNAFAVVDEELTALLDQAAAAPAEESVALYQQANKMITEKAYIVGVAVMQEVFVTQPNLAGVQVNQHNVWLDPTLVYPAQ
jgi:peptide/nickel transport system substrate-binding protein